MSKQRAAGNFWFLLSKNPVETVLMLKTAYMEDDLGKTQIYKWSSHFLSGEMTINDKRSWSWTPFIVKNWQSFC